MDSVKPYKAWMVHETKIKKEVEKIYRSYWPYLRSLSCEELTALSTYKYNSSDINTLLRVMSATSTDAPSIDHLRYILMAQLISADSSLSNSRREAIKFVKTIQGKIIALEGLYASAPRLKKQLVVYRGTALGEMAGYDVEKLKKGTVFGTAGFFSTSYDIAMALMFANFNGVLFRVLLPQNTPYILLPGGAGTDYTKSPSRRKTLEQSIYDQMELVLNRRTLFKVLSVEELQVSSQILKTRKLKMYTIKYIGEAEPLRHLSPEEVLDKVATLQLSLAEPYKEGW